MHHVIAWSEGIVAAGTLQPIAAVPDDQVFTEGDDFRVPEGYQNLLAAFAQGTGTTRARIVAPSLRSFINQELDPKILGANYGSGVFSTAEPWFYNPLPLAVGEAINFESDGGAVGPEDVSCIALLGSGPLQPVTGDIRTVRATAAIAGTRQVWSAGNMTFSEDLPAGRYAIVGARCEMDDPGAFRFIPREGGMRPGALAELNGSQNQNRLFRRGAMGVWCEFDVNQPPRLEVLAIGAASAAQVVYLDLLRVR